MLYLRNKSFVIQETISEVAEPVKRKGTGETLSYMHTYGLCRYSTYNCNLNKVRISFI